MQSKQKGFTLIELLVVIAIIAVLSVVVILTLNPAELLRQARDSNRISDLNTMKSAISLFLVDTASSTGLGLYTTCYSSAPNPNEVSQQCNLIFEPDPTVTSTKAAATAPKVDGAGWIPIDFTRISSGAPIGTLPVDPVNATPTYYFYRASSTAATFKMGVRLESSKYGFGGGSDVVANDGGNNTSTYEVGTNLAM